MATKSLPRAQQYIRLLERTDKPLGTKELADGVVPRVESKVAGIELAGLVRRGKAQRVGRGLFASLDAAVTDDDTSADTVLAVASPSRMPAPPAAKPTGSRAHSMGSAAQQMTLTILPQPDGNLAAFNVDDGSVWVIRPAAVVVND